MPQTSETGLSAPRSLRCEYRENPLGIDELRPRLSWQVSDTRRSAVQTAYQILIASSEEVLGTDHPDLWNTGKVISDQNLHVEYEGSDLQSRHRYFWKVRTWDRDDKPSPWSEVAWWEMGLLKPEEWQGAWIGFKRKEAKAESRPCPYLRKEFATKGPVARARVYATALGLYELHVNGKRVGEDVFTPGWTDYKKRIQYQTYDVTDMIESGENTITAILGDGWYCGHIAIFGKDKYGDGPRLLLQLVIRYPDGTAQTITTDESWKVSTGPILESDLYMGETYDARLEMPGWDTTRFDDSKWQEPHVWARGATPLRGQRSPAVQRTEELKPAKVWKSTGNKYVFDLGQNMVGRARLKVRGRAGTEITLRFAEMLNPDKTIYVENLRSAKCTDRYILKGGGEEVYEPRFTFRGFRYVEVSGYPVKPPLDAITGVVLHSATAPAGSFECSHEMVNQLQRNIVWGQRGNYLEVPTDCPQRDERLGWTGDAQVFVRTACFNMDVSTFFTKWADDLQDAQKPDGAFTDVAPFVGCGAGVAAWADAGVICPWTIYLCYGDTRILEKHFDAMARWIEYCRANSTNLIRPDEGYGDWLSINADTPKDLLGTAYFAYSTGLMAHIAQVLGKSDDVKKYDALFQDIKAAFNKEYVTPSGRMVGHTQTGYVLGLYFDLLPDDKRAAAAEYLISDIKKRDNHLSTGFVGTAYLPSVLTEAGHLDVAYQLLLNETFPSWGYMIKQGATTIWERWDGWTDDKGFQTPKMNSFNHYAFGSIGEWLYRTIAGIDCDPAQPGYKHIIIRPRPGGGLTNAKAEYDSMYGRVVSHWKKDDGTFSLRVLIPANARATIHIPAASPDQVTESGQPLSQAQGVSEVRFEKGTVVLEAGAGTYEFSAVLP